MGLMVRFGSIDNVVGWINRYMINGLVVHVEILRELTRAQVL